MAITVVQQNGGVVSGSTTLDVALASMYSTSNQAVVFVTLNSSVGTSTVDDLSGNTWSMAYRKAHTAGVTQECWHSTLTVTPTGGLSVQAHLDGAVVSSGQMLVAEITDDGGGGITWTKVSTGASTGTSSQATPGSVTTDAPNSTAICLNAYCAANGFSLRSNPTGYSSMASVTASTATASMRLECYSKAVTSTTTENPASTSVATENWVDGILILAAQSGAGGGRRPAGRMRMGVGR